MRILYILLICVGILFFQLIAIPEVDLFLIGVILVCFFYTDIDSSAFALIGGFLHDMYFPLYGSHFVIYALVVLVGIILIQTLITHRSLLGFIGFSLSLILLAQAFSGVSVFLQALLFHGMAQHALLGLSEVMHGLTSGFISFVLCLVGYALLNRMSWRGYGISIESSL